MADAPQREPGCRHSAGSQDRAPSLLPPAESHCCVALGQSFGLHGEFKVRGFCLWGFCPCHCGGSVPATVSRVRSLSLFSLVQCKRRYPLCSPLCAFEHLLWARQPQSLRYRDKRMHFPPSRGLQNGWRVDKQRNALRSILRAKAVCTGHRQVRGGDRRESPGTSQLSHLEIHGG